MEKKASENKKELSYNEINPKCEPLTPEKLRSFEGYENRSEEDLLEIVDTLSILAEILYNCASRKKEEINE